MTRDQAERLGSYVLDAGYDGTLIVLGIGTEFAVKIKQPCYFCWSFQDWSEFAAQQKKQRKQQRREVMRGIDASDQYRLVGV